MICTTGSKNQPRGRTASGHIVSFVIRNTDPLSSISTRCLSLESAIERALRQYPSLRSYFISEPDSAVRFQRLRKAFTDPLTEVYLWFMQSVFPTLVNANKFVQREEPLIHCLHPQLQYLVL